MTPSDGMGTQHLLKNPLALPVRDHNHRRCWWNIRGQGVSFSGGRFLPVNMRDKPQVQGRNIQSEPTSIHLQRAEGMRDLPRERQRPVSSIGRMRYQSYRGRGSRTPNVCCCNTRSANSVRGEVSLPRGAEQILDTHPRSLGLCLDSSTITEGCQKRTGGR